MKFLILGGGGGGGSFLIHLNVTYEPTILCMVFNDFPRNTNLTHLPPLLFGVAQFFFAQALPNISQHLNHAMQVLWLSSSWEVCDNC